MKDTHSFFNYISIFGFDGSKGNEEQLSIAADRVLEHTRTDLVQKLAGLDSQATAFLISLPTFLCSEIDHQGNVYVEYGRVISTSKIRREFSFEFVSEINFGVISFEDSIEVAEVFGLNRFQPHRTHWAVMPGDAGAIVSKLSLKQPSVQVKPTQSDGNARPPEIHIMGVADNVEQFLEHVFGATTHEGVDYFFRGHEDAEFQLVPSVMREWDSGAPKYLPNEDLMAKELLISNYDEFQNDQFCFDRLVRMQHYGLPTRLFDLSSNPLIALYFACEDGLGNDGQVLVFGVKREKIKYFDSDTVSCLANLSKLSSTERDSIDTSLGIEDFNRSYPIRQLWHHIRAEKPYFEARIDPEDVGSIICVKAKMTNSRIKSQHGAFLLFGHRAKMPSDGIDGISIQRITIKNKSSIKKRLDSININASTVYPSIEKSAEKIKASFQISEF